MNTKLHIDQRPRLVHKETGTFYPIATFEDLKETMQLMERAATNIRPYLSEWYDKVFLQAFQELDGKPNIYENDVGMPIKENYVGLITEQLAAKTQEIMHVHKPSTDDIRKSYLYPLINLGLVDKAPSVKDHRHNVFYPVETGNITGSNKNKILVSDPNLYPMRSVIEESFRTLVKYDAEGSTLFDQITDYRIEDVDGRKIELGELLDRYFSNPEEYFEREENN